MLNIVSAFATSGDPSSTEEFGPIWEPVQVWLIAWELAETNIFLFQAETGISRYLRVDSPCSMETSPELERELKFWCEVE